MEVYSYTASDLEENADIAKTVIMGALVSEGWIDATAADDWCATHTLRLRKRSMWRTITSRWRKEKEAELATYVVVKTIEG